MSAHWSSKLKVQKLDRRMTGHGHFKYRMEFPWGAFNLTRSAEPYRDRARTYYDFCKHLTETFGYGPHVDDVGTLCMTLDEAPRWAFRPISHTHTYAIYVADEEGRQEIEKVISFNILSN